MGFPSPYVLAPRPPTAGVGAGAPGMVQGGRLIGANMNSTADQAIPIVSPTPFYNIFRVVGANPSISLTMAVGALYLEAGKTKSIIAPATAWSALTNNTIDTAGNTTSFAIQTQYLTDNATIYLSLTTAQGVAATCDVYIYIIPFW